MSRLRTLRLRLIIISLACMSWLGCGGGEFDADRLKKAGSARAIALDGAEYILKRSGATTHGSGPSGLQSLGDIDYDGHPDLVLALNRKGSSAPSEHTWIEAYSGKNGKLLWSLQGKYDRDPKIGYRLGAIAAIDDLDGDDVRDVYSQEAHGKRTALLISGRSGKILGRYPTERKRGFDLPIRWRDCNSDGVPDLVFSRDSDPLEVVVLSGKDLAELERIEDVWSEATSGYPQWVLPKYHDDNADGVADCLVREEVAGTCKYAVLDGKTFTVLRAFESPRPRIGAKTFFAIVDDINGDQVGDLVLSSGAGGGPEGKQTLLRALSGADGTVLWDVGGDQVGPGVEVFTVDAGTDEKKSLGRDVGFGNAVSTAPDMNGDGVTDLAVLTDAGASDGAQAAILIISSKTGDVISVLNAGGRQGKLMRGNQMIRLQPKSGSKSLVIAAYARSSEGNALVAILTAKPSK